MSHLGAAAAFLSGGDFFFANGGQLGRGIAKVDGGRSGRDQVVEFGLQKAKDGIVTDLVQFSLDCIRMQVHGQAQDSMHAHATDLGVDPALGPLGGEVTDKYKAFRVISPGTAAFAPLDRVTYIQVLGDAKEGNGG